MKKNFLSLKILQGTVLLMGAFYGIFAGNLEASTCTASLITNLNNIAKKVESKIQDSVYPNNLGATITDAGVDFKVWLPNANEVWLVTSIDGWKLDSHRMNKDEASGNWSYSLPVEGRKEGIQYKYRIIKSDGTQDWRTDPVSRYVVRDDSEIKWKDGKNGEARVSGYAWNSVVWNPKSFRWSDKSFKPSEKPVILEINPATFISGKERVNFRELADLVLNEAKDAGATHIYLMPVVHHNLAESWGYQVGSLFSIDYRHGNPNDFKYFVDKLHNEGLAVIFDLVHSHASKDWDTGLSKIDGTDLYFKDGQLGWHPVWGTRNYDYGKQEVSDFLISNALFWIKEYHLDGFRVDALDSMIHLDFGRSGGTGGFNASGNINYDAIKYIQRLNREVHKFKKGFITIAEDSSGYPGLTQKEGDGGLGFDYKWSMSGMHYMREFLSGSGQFEAIFIPNLKTRDNLINYSDSHDSAYSFGYLIEEIKEVSTSERLAISRNVYSHLYLNLIGSPQIFQGNQYGTRGKWSLLSGPMRWLKGKPESLYAKHEKFIKSLSDVLNNETAFFRNEKIEGETFKHLLIDDFTKISVVARYAPKQEDDLIVVQNWSNLDSNVRIPVTAKKRWEVVFDSDAPQFGGKGMTIEISQTFDEPINGMPQSLTISLPAYSTVVLKQAKE